MKIIRFVSCVLLHCLLNLINVLMFIIRCFGVMTSSCFLLAQVTHLECCFNGSACYFSEYLTVLSSLKYQY